MLRWKSRFRIQPCQIPAKSLFPAFVSESLFWDCWKNRIEDPSVGPWGLSVGDSQTTLWRVCCWCAFLPAVFGAHVFLLRKIAPTRHCEEQSTFIFYIVPPGKIFFSVQRLPADSILKCVGLSRHWQKTKLEIVLSVNRIFDFQDFCYLRNMFEHMVERSRGKDNKGVLDRPWTIWRVLKAISNTSKCQFTGNHELEKI